MIRATAISAIDQGLLSALNFGLAVLLIHFASKEEYGLYSQLINLQSFFSPIHAGIFASAYLALASNMVETRRLEFRSAMARAEVAITTLSVVFVLAAGAVGASLFQPALARGTWLAFGIALLGLWWREFARQMQFAALNFNRALKIDVIYCAATLVLVLCVAATTVVSTASVLWCMAIGAICASLTPLLSAIRAVPVGACAIKRDLVMSWKMGRWEVLGSIVTWGYAQSYVYFAALHGGLDAAAEISAGRLLAAPLALMWASYANVLRPNASRMLTVGLPAAIRDLARRSALFVVVSSLLYALVIYTLIPILDQKVFGGKFHQLRSLAMWWAVYFTLTGVSTVASSVLRSAFEFREVFHRQLLSCIAAVVLLTVGLRFAAVESLVIALVVVEAISGALFWHRLNITLSLNPKTA